ncbi:Odorant receptor 118 [Blattella germanica]|nr:Odorant receptor 118 [Blattella germanica]
MVTGSPTASSLEVNQESNKKWLRAKQFHLSFLNIIGILPSQSISSNKYKLFIYNIFCVINMSIKFPIAILVFCNISHAWGDFSDVSDTVHITNAVSLDGVMFTYLFFKRKELENIFNQMQSKFMKITEQIVSPQIYQTVVDRTTRRCWILSTIFITWLSFMIAVWTVLPFSLLFVPHLMEVGSTLKNETSYVFMLPMWWPEELKMTPIYEIVFVIQLFETFYCLTIIAAFGTVYLYIVNGIVMRFEILGYCIEHTEANIRYWLENASEQSGNIENKLTNSDNQIKFEERERLQQLEKGIHEVDNNLQQDFEIEVSLINQLMDTNKTREEEEEEEEEMFRIYLLQWIKIHQDLLDYCEEIKIFFNVLLMAFFTTISLNMIFLAFGLAQDSRNSIVAVTLSAIYAFGCPYLLCLYGDKLTEASLNIKDAAYSCEWYTKSPVIKRMLQMIIMRAQSPVVLKAGWYSISLEQFSEIINTVYAYFNIMRENANKN